MERRWSDAASRGTWIGSLVERALRFLRSGAWTVEHPVGWNPSEGAELGDWITRETGAKPTLVPVAEIPAGLRLVAGDTRVDGTIDGLLADRAEIEGHLLGELLRIAQAEKNGGGS